MQTSNHASLSITTVIIIHRQHSLMVVINLTCKDSCNNTRIGNLSKAGVPACDIVYIYCSVGRSVLEYACAVWHLRLSNKLSKDIERVQKCCLKIIYPKLSYSEALEKSGLVHLDIHHEDITQENF